MLIHQRVSGNSITSQLWHQWTHPMAHRRLGVTSGNPRCGHCRKFEPQYKQLAKSGTEKTDAARKAVRSLGTQFLLSLHLHPKWPSFVGKYSSTMVRIWVIGPLKHEGFSENGNHRYGNWLWELALGPPGESELTLTRTVPMKNCSFTSDCCFFV